jgi:Kyakuja-Dileera-Zisupton transposase
MDYSIFKALNFNMGGIEVALICYDVMCQWSVHMKDRVDGSRYLKIPDGLELRFGIGLFHIHGHQDTCLARYSPSFIDGARQIDGETIETLWAPLNEISRSTRGMTTSHRREVIDDHMNDSNWKKLVDLGRLPLTGPESELTEITQSMLYLNATARRFLGQRSVRQHSIT